MDTLFERMSETQRAHARRTDPDTSHEAAAAATAGIERQRRLVEAYAKGRGEQGFMDIELEEAHPLESDSGLRTRRSELTVRNIVLDSKRRERHPNSARRRIVWVHRDFVDDPPAIKEADPTAGQLEVLRGEAHEMAAKLRPFAARLRRDYGLTGGAEMLEQTADLLAKLAR